MQSASGKSLRKAEKKEDVGTAIKPLKTPEVVIVISGLFAAQEPIILK